MAQVKGVAILGLIKYIKKNHKDVLNKIVESLPQASAKYMNEHILVTEWYPYQLYTDLLKALDRVVGKGDLSTCIEQGRLSAKHDLATIFKIFTNFSSVQSMLSRVMVAWTSYYDTGKVEITPLTDKEATYLIKDFPDIDLAHVKNVQGWVEEFFKIVLKIKDVRSEIVKCQCKGDPVTEIHFTFIS
ncbi:MAG: hypothetical protein ACP5MB_05430 [bacterium]